MADPETFLQAHRGCRITLDEIHRLPNPSEILKIAADHFPDIRILATGSSTLTAFAKFRDTLTGRKADVWLTPATQEDLQDFGIQDLERRLLRGGLPPFLLGTEGSGRDYEDWLTQYWARDALELFRIGRRQAFTRFAELLLAQSGGIFEATRFAGPCEVSRPTIRNYLDLLETTYVAHVVRPFSARRSTEIISAPRVYGFDTGFVCCHKGWRELHRQDLGLLWEHLVLNELQARRQSRRGIHYWRDKRGHEVDFILAEPGVAPTAIECKWTADAFEPNGLLSFRKRHPGGANVVVAQDVREPFGRSYGSVAVRFVGIGEVARTGLGVT